jgi:hypothetical protein
MILTAHKFKACLRTSIVQSFRGKGKDNDKSCKPSKKHLETRQKIGFRLNILGKRPR